MVVDYAAARAAAPGPTAILRLTATGAVQAAPGLLVAPPMLQNTATSLADVQRRVNKTVAGGIQAARAAAGAKGRATG